jgi:SNF2 family DNA or RNA helicase
MLDEEYTKSLIEAYEDCPRCHGTRQVNKKERVAKEIPCPKEEALKRRLAQCEETGRVVIFSGFQGSVDRIRKILFKEGWDVVQCDGRGWVVYDKTGKIIKTNKPLHFWADLEHHEKVAFNAHPASGGLSLNLTEARMEIFWSNDFNPESRSQAEDRIHRKGMDTNLGCKIVDLFHLPSDEKVRNVLKENRKLELMTMGELLKIYEDEETNDE